MINILILLAGFSITQTDEVRLVNNICESMTNKCWTPDRISNKKIISVSTTGVGFYAYARAVELGEMTRENAIEYIWVGFDMMREINKGYDGWLMHFVDIDGKPVNDTEVSSIDTVIFYLGAEMAARRLNDQKLLDHILLGKSTINLQVMMDSEGFFYHGFSTGSPRVMSKYKWHNYNEGVLIYKYFNKPFKPSITTYDQPLFVYYYPLAFYPDEREWIENLGKAIKYQKRMTKIFGYTACDGPNGYVVNSPYVISPLAITCCKNYFPDEVKFELAFRHFVDPLCQSITINEEWKSKDRILIDDGIALILLGNKK